MIRSYLNGNTRVTINDRNGSKTRFTWDDHFEPEYAECCDVHISDACDNGCTFCYAGCTPWGKTGRFDYEFLNNLHPHTEMAINLQDPIPPGIEEFLYKMQRQDIIVNVTINQNHFMRDDFRHFVKKLQDDWLIYGVGISLVEPTPEFFEYVKEIKSVVIHVINGVVTLKDLYKLKKNNMKVLILGYKSIGRGKEYMGINYYDINDNMGELANNLRGIIKGNWFPVLSFDNLALEQLPVRDILTPDEWERMYQGDDGISTFFINLVDGTFGINSLTTKEERMEIGDKSIDEMFKEVKKWKKKEV